MRPEPKINPLSLLSPRRKIKGISAILLPFRRNGTVDWRGFEGHVERTLRAGLVPAVNMDTGYVNLLDDKTRLTALRRAGKLAGRKGFVAGRKRTNRPDRQGRKGK
jgi:dihydrodipicolinate synthase/N-acetylneuraminate lyase